MKLISLTKFTTFFVICILYFFIYTNCSENKSSLQNHFKMMTQFKIQSKMFLNNLFETANTHANSLEKAKEEILKKKNSSSKKREETEKAKTNTNTNTNTNSKTKNVSAMRKSIMKQKTITHTSDLKQEHVKYTQFRYKRYEEIISRMQKLAKKYPKFLKVENAQKLYGLPHPGGYCGKRKKK